ncbi:vacuolar protein-sorting-associated protein 33 homolog [Physcomitrium patens]|uniref:SM/Sec1-family protein n=1 Tax=Physcomitrium patens TaxID=3218 RepID=A0A2K1J2T9_PHYPA|nr:vacuolar protein-sorting-associated protein 33 homolog [Physcomitrium patens]PNR35840.1 hypothetical protein PHYPA_021690 [Physcomitrium patens]|eukprot:XP_024401527.1 vacuolar protein-sorting-associated protein 33 homolog [Physcomitrella patens]
MAQLPNLDNGPVNLSNLREQAQRELGEVLDSMRGKKVLVLDPQLSGPLALIAQTSLLKEHGVENLYYVDADPVQTECKNVIYLVRPRIPLMKQIVAHIEQDNGRQLQKSYSVIFMPRRTIVCEKVLDEVKAVGNVTIREFPLYFIPFDEDVLSLELERSFKETKVDGDTSSLWYMARAITKLQELYGVIPNVKGKGKAASQVSDILLRMQREQAPPLPASAKPPEIDTLILIDRQVDMVTPMCSQLTYEGVIDEFIQINNGAVEVEPSVMGAPPSNNAQVSTKKVKVPLNSSDKLYREIRDLNFGVVGQVLRQKAVSIKQDYSDVTAADNQSISDVKDFVKKLNVLPEITRHVNIAQHLSKFTTKPTFLSRLSMEQTLVEGQNYDASFTYVEEMIHRQEPIESVLRLLILLSVTNNGLPKKHYDYLRRELLHSYGFEHMFTLSNLEKAGLLIKQEAKSNWQAVKKGINLVPEENDDINPSDIAYVFSGYAPLSIRLVQWALRGEWQQSEFLRLLPGATFERFEKNQEVNIIRRETVPSTDSVPGTDARRLVILVIFIGGVTFAEISALRFLESQEGMKYDFIIATTKLVNGTTLVKSLIDDPSAS